MRFLHTADWHVGKKLNGFDLLAEQHDAFLKINQLAKDYKVDAVVVAGGPLRPLSSKRRGGRRVK